MRAETAVYLGLGVLALLALGRYLWWLWQHQVVEVISRDDKTLRSVRYGLSGRPDRLVRLRNGAVIPIEKKGRDYQESAAMQLGAYLILTEEAYGRRPPYGVLEVGDGTQYRIANTQRRRRAVLSTVARIQAQRANLNRDARGVKATARQCARCGYRHVCPQRRRG